MIIDDDPKVSKALELIFREYEILEFQDPQKGLEFLQKPNEVPLVLLDVYIGEINGIDILNQIKALNKNIAVIVMTAFGTKDVAVEALRGHADDFIDKPFEVSELRDKVRAILKEKSYLQNADHENHVDRIKRFIERSPESISLRHVADELCLSPKYISRLFKEKSNGGFRDYKVTVKMNRAKELLAKSSYTVSQISDKLGYQNPESFMRIFKRTTKNTPSQYRNKHRFAHA
jgi:YesN/AraC family two-component response regulator